MLNLLNLEEKITCGKIKSNAKTIFIGNLNKVNKQSENNIENIIFPSINVDKFIIKYGNSNDFNLLCSHLLNSTIIISNSSNPKESISHILVLPWYLSVINKLDNNQINLHIIVSLGETYYNNGEYKNEYNKLYYEKFILEYIE